MGTAYLADKVKEFGITEVELAGTYNLTPEQFKAELDSRGLKAVSSHFPYARYKTDLDAVVRDAKALGMFFDTHTHLANRKFDLDLPAVLERARAAGVTRMVAPAALMTGLAPRRAIE